MADEALDIGFVPVECPGNTGTGATHTSTLLIEELSRYHDLTVYVSSQREADPTALPAQNRVEYVLHDRLAWTPHPITVKQHALKSEIPALNQHDLVHSYSSAFLPVLANLGVPTIMTLNSYLAICPKADFRYLGTQQCSGPGLTKCSLCIPLTGLKRRNSAFSELKSAYLSFGRIPLVSRSIRKRNQISHFHALSPHLRDHFVDVGFDPARTSVVPHFFDERFLSTEQSQPQDGQPVRLLYVGALLDIKGVDVLINSLRHLLDWGVNFELHVVGTGPREDFLRTRAVEISVSDRIIWHGHLPYERLPAVYEEADLFIYPGVIEEPFGRVILEALASHTPIVSASIGSMETIVGPCGTFFEPGNPQSLANAVQAVLGEYPTFLNAIPSHRTQFAPSEILDRFNELYRNTIDSNDRG